MSLFGKRKRGSDSIPRQETLRLFEIRRELKKTYGIHIRSSQQLNKILEEMGIQYKEHGSWRLTDYGEQYNAFHKGVINPDLWMYSIVPLIASYINNNR